MCGIAGFFHKERCDADVLLGAMLQTIRHRGPDGSGQLIDGAFALGMTRLAIIDLEGGDQPIYNEDRSIAVICNGEIYNYREIRRDLKKSGHRFRTNSDCEVLVHLYEQYGDAVAEHVEGMFAFAIYDSQRRRMLLARDRLGIKPLFLADTSRAVIFGSEIKALLCHPGIDRSLDLQAVDEYLTYTYVPAPRTIYRGIRKVSPGTCITIDEHGTVDSFRYWTPKATPDLPGSESDLTDLVGQQLAEAVRSHLVSDVPVGVFLSGGIDSSLIAALAARENNDAIMSVTVAFENSGAAFIDERNFAREVAIRYGLDHREIVVKPDFTAIADDILDAFDEPFADDSVIPSYYLCQATSDLLKVALSGLGGDELFAGYRRHLGLVLGERYRKIPRTVSRNLIEPIIRWLPESTESSHTVDHLKRFLRSAGSPADVRYQDSLSSIEDARRERLYGADVAKEIDPRATREVITARMGRGTDVLNDALRADIDTYLVDDVLTLTDRLSMWHSLEVRVPFLDRKVVEMALGIPSALKVRRNRQKYILRKVARRHVPSSILNHRKQGFEAPMARWLRGPMKEQMIDTLTGSSATGSGLFDKQHVESLIADHLSLNAQNSKILFSLLVFEGWYSRRPAPFRATS